MLCEARQSAESMILQHHPTPRFRHSGRCYYLRKEQSCPGPRHNTWRVKIELMAHSPTAASTPTHSPRPGFMPIRDLLCLSSAFYGDSVLFRYQTIFKKAYRSLDTGSNSPYSVSMTTALYPITKQSKTSFLAQLRPITLALFPRKPQGARVPWHPVRFRWQPDPLLASLLRFI